MSIGMIGLTAALALASASTQRAAGQSAPARSPDVHFVPTRMEVVTAMLNVAKVGPKDVVYDLGSGDGRIVITAASRHGARGIGIDIDPVRVTESRRNADSAGVSQRVTFRQADLFETDFREASVVTLYLLPSLNVRLRPKLYRELRPGTRVVSHAFDMGDWKADSTIEVSSETGGTSNVYYWVMPADVSGDWAVAVEGGDKYRLSFQQQYQRLAGTAALHGRRLPLERPQVVGDSLMFALQDTGSDEARTLRFKGWVNGNRAEGTITDGTGRSRKWAAAREARGPRR
jgi:precorrin-6B methylase 2